MRKIDRDDQCGRRTGGAGALQPKLDRLVERHAVIVDRLSAGRSGKFACQRIWRDKDRASDAACVAKCGEGADEETRRELHSLLLAEGALHAPL